LKTSTAFFYKKDCQTTRKLWHT